MKYEKKFALTALHALKREVPATIEGSTTTDGLRTAYTRTNGL